MEYALVGGLKAKATLSGSRGVCRCCQAETVAKCGGVVLWHWAHMAGADCDDWHSVEGEWHRGWKDNFPEECRETVMGPHRADVRLPDGLVLEFQSKGLSAAEFAEREQFYGKMIWVFDVRDVCAEGRFFSKDNWATFTWSHQWKSLHACKMPIVLDIGHGRLVWVKGLPPKRERGGFRFDVASSRAIWCDDQWGPGRTWKGLLAQKSHFLEELVPVLTQHKLFGGGA